MVTTLFTSIVALTLTLTTPAAAHAPQESSFAVVALGVEGGLKGGNLTSLLVGSRGRGTFIALDAGTVVDGIALAFPDERVGDVLRKRIRGYAITHPHIDHVAGLALASTDDVAKPLYALPSTIEALQSHMFNWSLWPNMGDAGKAPALGRLRYTPLSPDKAKGPVHVDGTGLTLEAFPLSHAGTTSTAFLVRNEGGHALLHLGDCGTDAHEKTDRLERLWARTAPLVRDGLLRAIVIEASYSDARSDAELFGHLTPKHVKAELGRLAALVRPDAPARALAGITIVVVHVKPSLTGDDPRTTIARELGAELFGARVVLPRQGEHLAL